MVFQRRLCPNWRRGFIASHLSYTWQPPAQYQATVKLHRVFLSCRRSSASSRTPQFHRALRRDNGQVVQPFMRVGTYPTRDFATLGMLLLLRSLCRSWKGTAISAALCTSPCRSDHIFSPVPLGESGVWSLRIPGRNAFPPSLAFPADCPHRSHCHRNRIEVAPDTDRTSQHIARFCNGLGS